MTTLLTALLLAAAVSAENLDNRGIIPTSRARSRAVAASHAAAARNGHVAAAQISAPRAAAASGSVGYTGSTHPAETAPAARKAIARPMIGRKATGDLNPVPSVTVKSSVGGPTAAPAGAPGGPTASFTNTAAAGSPIAVDNKRSQSLGGTGAGVGKEDTPPGANSGGDSDPLGKILKNMMKLFSGLLGGS